MAEVRKRIVEDKYNTKNIKNTLKKEKNVKDKKKKVKAASNIKNKDEEKKSIFYKFRVFCHGVKSEFLKVHWPSKSDMLKYSVATIVFIVFCSVFFFSIDIIFAFIQSLFS